MLNSKLKVW